MITDKDRVEWLMKRVNYMEHSDKDGGSKQGKGEGGYWPQNEDDLSMGQVYLLCGLSFIEYIDALIAEERK